MPLSRKPKTAASLHQPPTVESEDDGSPAPDERRASDGPHAAADGQDDADESVRQVVDDAGEGLSITETRMEDQRASTTSRYRPAHVSDHDESESDYRVNRGRSGNKLKEEAAAEVCISCAGQCDRLQLG